jgi:hypothetical protein
MTWRRMEELRYSSTTLGLGTRCRRVVGFTPRQLCSPGKSLRYPLDRRLGGPQNRYGHCGIKKKILFLPGIEPRSRLATLTKLIKREKHFWRLGFATVYRVRATIPRYTTLHHATFPRFPCTDAAPTVAESWTIVANCRSVDEGRK